MPGSVFYRIADGKIVEFWGQLDMMSLMQQIGAILTPEQLEEASPTGPSTIRTPPRFPRMPFT